MMAVYLYLSPFPPRTVIALVVCSLIALFMIRMEFDASKLRTRFTVAAILAIAMAVPLAANPVYFLCDWDQIMAVCNGSEVCAWTVWLMNACYW